MMTCKDLKTIMAARKCTVEQLSKITGYSVGNIQHALKSGNITTTMELGIRNAELVELFIISIADRERKAKRIVKYLQIAIALLLTATLILAFLK